MAKSHEQKLYEANLQSAHDNLRGALRAFQDKRYKSAIGFLNLAEQAANRAKVIADDHKRGVMRQQATSDSSGSP